jgi:hypothetical protein
MSPALGAQLWLVDSGEKLSDSRNGYLAAIAHPGNHPEANPWHCDRQQCRMPTRNITSSILGPEFPTEALNPLKPLASLRVSTL